MQNGNDKMMDQRKIVAVLGATGMQGGSVVEEFLKWPSKYQIRGLTRDKTSAKSKKLASQGVEVVSADLCDPASLQRAFEGAHIIYAMTDFWQTMSSDIEYAQGKSIADIAANSPTLEHIVWASVPDGKVISGGLYPNIFHWQSKAAITDYIRDSHTDLWAKTTVVLFPNYFENCKTHPTRYLPVKHRDGSYVYSFPLSGTTVMPNAAITDTGKLVFQIVENSCEYYRKSVAFYSQAISEKEKFEIFAKAHNITVHYDQTPEEVFRSNMEKIMGARTALDITEQFKIFETFGNIYDKPEYVQANKIPGLKLKTWEEYIASENLMSYVQAFDDQKLV